MLLAAFRGKFFRHLGYVLDLLVVSTCLYQELAGKSKGKAALEGRLANSLPPRCTYTTLTMKCHGML